MWIIQEPKKVALWNKWNFEEKNRECAACLKYSVLIFVEKEYIKGNIWWVAVRLSYIWDTRFLKVNECFFILHVLSSTSSFTFLYITTLSLLLSCHSFISFTLLSPSLFFEVVLIVLFFLLFVYFISPYSASDKTLPVFVQYPDNVTGFVSNMTGICFYMYLTCMNIWISYDSCHLQNYVSCLVAFYPSYVFV